MKRLRESKVYQRENRPKRRRLSYPARPSDSPTNPFGRIHINALPLSSPFSKHLALRFQFSQAGIGPRLGGVYRVVQVPLNYTFVHLRCLIAFLYGGDIHDPKVPPFAAGDKFGHLFELKKNVVMYSTVYRPGQIKSGVTILKCSSVMDPCRSISDYQLDSADDCVFREELNWEDEDQLTLAQVWPKGIDLTRGIIYHHNSQTQIHITLNKGTLPRRKGRSNTPYVFTGRGRVWLDQIPAQTLQDPHVPHLISITSSKRPQRRLSISTSSSVSPTKILTSPITDLSSPFTSPEMSQTKSLHSNRSLAPKSSPHDHVAEGEVVNQDEVDVGYTSGSGDILSPDIPKQGIKNRSLHEKSRGYASLNEDTSDSSDNQTEEEVEDLTIEDYTIDLSTEAFNAPHAFSSFFAVYIQVMLPFSDRQYDHDDSEDEGQRTDGDDGELVYHPSSTPGLSSPIRTALAMSSPMLTPSSRYSSTEDGSDADENSYSSASMKRQNTSSPCSSEASFDLNTYHPLPFAIYKPTPAPARSQRLRIARVEWRIEKSKRGSWLNKRGKVYDDVVEEAQKEAADKESDGDEEEDEDAENGSEEFVKPHLREGEEWDPFGDELEV